MRKQSIPGRLSPPMQPGYEATRGAPIQHDSSAAALSFVIIEVPHKDFPVFVAPLQLQVQKSYEPRSTVGKVH